MEPIRAFWHALEEQTNGSIIVSFPTSGTESAARTVLHYGTDVLVLEPRRARAVAAQYTAESLGKGSP